MQPGFKPFLSPCFQLSSSLGPACLPISLLAASFMAPASSLERVPFWELADSTLGIIENSRKSGSCKIKSTRSLSYLALAVLAIEEAATGLIRKRHTIPYSHPMGSTVLGRLNQALPGLFYLTFRLPPVLWKAKRKRLKVIVARVATLPLRLIQFLV